jgi:hypothetical protein
MIGLHCRDAIDRFNERGGLWTAAVYPQVQLVARVAAKRPERLFGFGKAATDDLNCGLQQPQFHRGKRQVPVSENAQSAEAIRRKLRAIAAVLLDPAITESERANARALEIRLLERLGQGATSEGTSAGTWADVLFRLGRGVRQIKQIKRSTAPSSPKGDWTDNAFRLGRLVRRSFKK